MNDEFRKALQHGPDCPPAETLIGVMEHGDPGDRAGINQHLHSCPACQTELAMYRGFEAGEVSADERSAVDFIVKRLQRPAAIVPSTPSLWQRIFTRQQNFFTSRWMGVAALAMAAVLLTIGLTSQSRTGRVNPPVADDQTLRTSAVTITSPTGEMNESPGFIEWQPLAGAAEYTVTLSEIDGNVIFHKTFTTSRIHLPEEIRNLIKPGKKVLLEVSAENRTGSEIARSGMVSIRVNPAGTGAH